MKNNKVLLLFAHPAYHKSRVNKQLVTALPKNDNLTFHDLYEVYPDFDIQVDHEQKLLTEHQVIIMHFPLFWYSTPAILKEWQDLVLEHGWAYGSNGNALKGKQFMCAITTGGPRAGYSEEGFHQHTLKQLLAPLFQTVTLCKMQVLSPLVLHGSHSISADAVKQHSRLYARLLDQFNQGSFQAAEAQNHSYMNEYLKA